MTDRYANRGLRKICACNRRIWAKCSHPWYFNFKPKGGPAYRFNLDRHLGRRLESKAEAETEADRIRGEIRDGTFGQPAPRAAMTLRQLVELYIERYVQVERAATVQSYTWALNSICRTAVPGIAGSPLPLGDWRVAEVVTDTIERLREARRANGGGVVGANRALEHLRALYNWAVRVGYVEQTPFRRQSQPVVRLSEEHSRSRRLDADTNEQGLLLAACGPHLRAVVECALETGMRRGEILSLQWTQVEGLQLAGGRVRWADRAELVLPWTKTKTRRDRRIPISSRLRAILAMRRFDPAEEPLPSTSYVFGNELGQQVKDIKRAWMTAVLRSHDHAPKFTATANLTRESRAALEAIDLHFHDLRREAGSRWLEGGVPLHTVRDWLGHTSIAQTSIYLSGTIQSAHDAMRQFEARTGDLQRLATGSATGGRKGARSAGPRATKLNESGPDRGQTVM